jgi:hypothetical protein
MTQPAKDAVASFQANHRAKMEFWRRRIADFRKTRRRVVVWGAGSKGVTFLNMLEIDHSLVPIVVDLNPRKHGFFVPCTGQQVVGPEVLRAFQPHVVLVMNPAYEHEIAGVLQQLGVAAELITV